MSQDSQNSHEKRPVYEYYVPSEPRFKEGDWQDDCMEGYDTSCGPAHSLGLDGINHPYWKIFHEEVKVTKQEVSFVDWK